MHAGHGDDTRKPGQQVGPWKLPRYSDLIPVKIRQSELDALGVGSVAGLVERVNGYRAALGLRYVTRSNFPTHPRFWKALVAELERHAGPDGPNPSLVVHEPAVRKVPTRRANSGRKVPPYTLDIPIMEFIAEYLDILPGDQAYAMDLALGLSGPWEDFDVIANGLVCTRDAARNTFKKGFDTFEKRSRCWSRITISTIPLLRYGPLSLDELLAQTWTSGMSLDVLDMVADKAIGINPTTFNELGKVYFMGDQLEIRNMGRFQNRLQYRGDAAITTKEQAQNAYLLMLGSTRALRMPYLP